MAKIDPKYRTSVTAQGGREGQAVSDDGVLDVQLRRPKINGESEGTNPEQLFAAAWAGCFGGAISVVGRETEVDLTNAIVKVEVSQGPDDEGGYGIGAKIWVTIPDLDREKVQEIAEAAHQVCPFSRATRGNVEVEITAV